MKIYLLSLCLCLTSITLLGQNPFQEERYQANDPELPYWAQLMYGDNPNLIEIEKAFDKYYQSNKFVKNQHTQYYKRWLRDKWQYMREDGTVDIPTDREKNNQIQQYLRKVETHSSTARNANPWEELGPWEYDHEATMDQSVQSPGAAHVYAMEQSMSNPDIVWAGTANAGLWKSIDKGISWECMTTSEIIKNVYSLEIDHSQANNVYAYSANRIWKTADGGSTWTATGSDQYFSWVRDIIMHPTNNNILLAASTGGLYRTIDAGNSWTRLKGGHWQEIEFHPTNNNIVYAVKQNGNHTELFKSVDGGINYTLKPNGWPGIVSNNATGAFNSLELDLASRASFANVELGSASIPDFTIEMRVKLDTWSSDPAIISNKNWNSGNNNGFVLACNGSGWKFNIGDGSSRIDLNGGNINDNEWHHIAVTYTATGDKKVFQDGALINSTSSNISTNINSGLALQIMQDGTSTYGANLAGNIAEVRIWNTALSDAQINNLVCSEVDNTHANYANLLHYWKLNETTGNSISDSKGSNNGNITGTHNWLSNNEMNCLETNLYGGENKRVEIAVTPAAPDNLYVLATGSANGSSGTYGFYKSTDAGESFTFTCCGGEPGGTPTADNPNLMGWSYDLTGAGGQYYYDMSLAVSPTDPNKIFAAGISVIRSEDGGSTWETNGHWVTWIGPNTKQRYTHADVHDVKFFNNGTSYDLWTASDGGLFYSANEGDNFEPRMHGIQGTEFWGFGGSYKEDVMLGGTYHNGTLVHYKDMYLKGKNGHGGWIGQGAGDQTYGYVHDGDGSKVFDGGGMRKLISRDIFWQGQPFDGSKAANFHGQPGRYGNYEWHPNYYEEYYSPRDSVLYKTEDDGLSWNQVYDFGLGKIYRVRIPASNPNIIYVIQDHQNLGKRLWKSIDAGNTFTDITPSDALTGNNNWRHKNFDIDHDNPDNIWILITGNANGNKIFQSTDGGNTWNNTTTAMLNNEYMLDISHHQGTDGGVYVGTGNTVFYKNNTMADWVLFNNNLPLLTRCGYLYPYYTEGKIRVGTYRGAYQADFYEDAAPTVRIAVDKKTSDCQRDTFYFKDLSYVQHDNVSWLWTFENGVPATSTEENPKVIFGEGSHTVSLTVTNAYGSATQTIENMVTLGNSDCNRERIPDLALTGQSSTYVNIGRPDNLNFDANEPYTFMAWIKPRTANQNGYILTKYDRYVAGQFQWGLENGRHMSHRETWPWQVTANTNLPLNEWSHIATTYDGTTLKIFTNGVETGSTTIGSINSISRDLLIGARHRSGNVNDHFQGEIDELSIWNRALSLDEIRLLRHLTLDNVNDANLISYYQFNEQGDIVYDRAGFNHATFFNTSRSTSDAPLGGGLSESKNITTTGQHNYPTVGTEINIGNGNSLPDGEVVITRVELNPNIKPNISETGKHYWIINNYGNNVSFTALNSLIFSNVNHLTPGVTAADLKLYQRSENSHTNNWTLKGNANQINTANNQISFTSNVSVTNFGQYAVSNEKAIGWIGVENTLWNNPNNWGGGIIPNSNSDVIIPADTPYQPMVNINAQVGSLLLMEGASIGVEDGVVFEVVE